MDGPRDYHTKWNKSEGERQIPYDITYMQNLKYDTNELIYKTETDIDNIFLCHRHRKQMYGYQRRKGVGEG